MPQLEKYLGEVYLWEYLPSLPAAIALAIVFLILTILHAWKVYQTRLYFCIPFAIGGLCTHPLNPKPKLQQCKQPTT